MRILLAVGLGVWACLTGIAGERVLLIGDSITEQGICVQGSGTYHQLTNVAAEVGADVTFVGLGFSGSHVGDWEAWEKKSRTEDVWQYAHVPGRRNLKDEFAKGADVIVFFLGQNDITRPLMTDEPASMDAWVERCRRLIVRLKERTKARDVVLGTITACGTDPESARNRGRRALNDRLRALAAHEGWRVADYGAVIDRLQRRTQRGWLFNLVGDYVHPSFRTIGHTAIAAELCRALGERRMAAALEARLAREIEANDFREKPCLSANLTADPDRRADKDEFDWTVDWRWTDARATPPERRRTPQVEVKLPEGFRFVSASDFHASAGTFVVRGKPVRLSQKIELAATYEGGRDTFHLPIHAPWRVLGGLDGADRWDAKGYRKDAPSSAADLAAAAGRWDEAGRPWSVFLSTPDYCGLWHAGNINAEQFTFGTETDAFYAARRIRSAKRRTVKAFFSHDTWHAVLGLRVWLNGREVFSDFMGGATKKLPIPDLTLEAGDNLLVIRADHRQGQRQFALDFEAISGDSLDDLRIDWMPNDHVRYSADLPGWRVTDMNDIEIRAGSALDLSSLGGSGEAGRFGPLAIGADGHLAFAKAKDTPVKLYGYVADWSDFVNYWRDKPKEEFHRLIDAFAVQVKRHGFNFVRPHGMLDQMETPDWQQTPRLTPDWIDRVDYIAAALKRQGVYLYIDFTAYGMRLGEKPMRSPLMKTAVMSGDRTYVDAWKSCTRQILEHVNPYTGTAWKDDPAVAIAMEFNEQATGAKLGTLRSGLRDQLPETTRAELLRRWNAWCAAKGWTEHPDWPESSKGSYAWSASFDVEPWGPRYHEFLSSLFLERAQEYNETARSLGFGGLLSAYNSDVDLGASAARWQASDVVSYNFHFGHPSSFGKGGSVSQADSCSMTARGYDFSCGARLRFHDRPYVSSEYSHAFWNFRRYEGGVLMPSYAALNGHDGILWHSGGVNLSAVGRWPRGRIEVFHIYTSPIMQAATFLGACLYRRGDVAEASHKVEVAYHNGIWEGMTRTAPSTEQARLGLVTRYGIAFPDLPRPDGVADVRADAVLKPATGDRIRDGEWVSSVVGDKSKGFDFDRCIRALKKRGILKDTNRTDASRLRFESETGELMLDGKEEWMTVDTLRTKAVAAPSGKRTDLGAFTVFGSTEDSLTALTSVDGRDLADSRRMVFIYATREANTGMVLSKDGRKMEECGWYPALLKTGRVSVRFATPHAAELKLFLLDYSGRRLEEVAIRREAGAVAFDLDTEKLSHGPTPLFELVAEVKRPKAPFGDGQTVAFVGDSITHAGGYAFYVQLFQALRAPKSRVRIVNGGISGDQLRDLLGRWTRDIVPMKPDVIFLMEGMNDVGRGNYRAKPAAADTFSVRTNALARYLANLGSAADLATKLAKEVRLVTPSPYDSYGDYGTENLQSANDEGLAACAEAVRLVAAEKGLPFVELQRPLTDILKAHPKKLLWGKDRVHPGDAGHLLMAAHLLEQLGVSGEVATTEKDANGRDTLSFDYAPDAFPFPAVPELEAVKSVYPFDERLNRETLVVRNLPDGEYELAFDGRTAGRFSAQALAAGVNLAELDTPNRRAAAEAAVAVKEMRAKTVVLRDIRHMDLMFANETAADAWLEKEKGSPWIGAFRNWVSTWKANKPKEAELMRQVDAAFARMYDVLKTKLCRVEIAPVRPADRNSAGTVP